MGPIPCVRLNGTNCQWWGGNLADSDTHAGRNHNGTFATRINGNLTALRCLINAITIIRETNDLVVLQLTSGQYACHLASNPTGQYHMPSNGPSAICISRVGQLLGAFQQCPNLQWYLPGNDLISHRQWEIWECPCAMVNAVLSQFFICAKC